jgi:hypothetical protein
MVTKSSIGDAVTKIVPEKEAAKEQLSEAKTEDETGNESTYPCYDRIKSIVLEEGVTEIGTGAFRDLKYVEKVTLPQSLTLIRNGAFSGCEQLQVIGRDASYGCSSLKEVYTPQNVSGIEKVRL